jgi:protein involved in sex pheromone biosynthesis
MRRALVLLSLALVVVASGCAGAASSSRKFSGEEKKVADQVEKIQSAGQTRDGKAICDNVLAASLRDKMAAGRSTCAAELDKALKDVDDYSLDVQSVAIAGATATAKVKGRIDGGKAVRTLTLARQGTTWRVTSLG